MESTQATMKIYMGEFKVVQVKLDGITINIGRNVHVTIHLGDFPHTLKAGDSIPMFTEVPYDNTRQAPIQ